MSMNPVVKPITAKRWLSLMLLALVLSGCSSLSDLKDDINGRIFGRESKEPAAPLEEFKPSAQAEVKWRASVGATGEYEFSPATDGDSVFAASHEGDVTRLESATGKQVWHINAGEKLSSGTGAGEGLVLVGTPKGMVLAFDHASGKQVWKARVSSEVLSAPKISNGVVVVRCGDSRIFGLDAADGKRKWVYERATPALTLRTAAGVTLADGVAYVGFAGGKMIALTAKEGKVLWEVAVAQPKGTTEIERIADITSLPVVDGRYVYVAAYQGRVVGIDRAGGRMLWNRDIASYTGLGSDGLRLYITQTSGSVYALDDTTGKSYWRQGALLNRRVSAPQPLKGYVAVGDYEGYVHFLDRDDGGFSARISTDGSAVMAQPVALNDTTLLVQTRSGGLFAISLK